MEGSVPHGGLCEMLATLNSGLQQMCGHEDKQLARDAMKSKGSWNALVIGAGGLGCEVLKNLVLIGFASIHIIDADTIELTDLNRQFLYLEGDVGKPKAEVAAQAINKRFSHLGVSVVPHYSRIQDKGSYFYLQFSIILCGLDNMEARRWINSVLLQNFMKNQGISASDSVEDETKTIALIDGGTEGFRGQARFVIPCRTACLDCSIGLLPTEVNYPLCTIVDTPRLPEHCIEYATTVLWDRHFPEETLDAYDARAFEWVFEKARGRAAEFGISGVTRDLTVGVMKKIVPIVASTNAIIAASMVNEALKWSLGVTDIRNNYIMYTGDQGVYTYTFNFEKNEECLVCNWYKKTLNCNEEDTLKCLLEKLRTTSTLQLQRPSISTKKRFLFLQNPPAVKKHFESKLTKPLKELLEGETEIYITDPSSPSYSVVNLIFNS